MKLYRVTLRDCVYMEKVMIVEADNMEYAAELAKRTEYEPHNSDLTWDTTDIQSLSPLVEIHKKAGEY